MLGARRGTRSAEAQVGSGLGRSGRTFERRGRNRERKPRNTGEQRVIHGRIHGRDAGGMTPSLPPTFPIGIYYDILLFFFGGGKQPVCPLDQSCIGVFFSFAVRKSDV